MSNGPSTRPTDATRATQDALYCEALVREHDHDRYLAALFAPADKRPPLMALYAFALELGRVRESVSDPLPGEVRLQWWRDTLEGEARGDVRANPVAAALDDAITRYRLPRQALTSMIDARIFDLYDDPMPTVTALEGYCGETSSLLIRLAALILADGRDLGGADAAGHAGVAYAVTGLLRAFPWHRARGQLYVPPEDVLARHGTDHARVMAGQGGSELLAALAEMRDLARRHLAQVLEAVAQLDPVIAPAFLPVTLVEPHLAVMERRDYDPYRTIVAVPQWRKQWALWRGARRFARR